jgi:hypothetical protein
MYFFTSYNLGVFIIKFTTDGGKNMQPDSAIMHKKVNWVDVLKRSISIVFFCFLLFLLCVSSSNLFNEIRNTNFSFTIKIILVLMIITTCFLVFKNIEKVKHNYLLYLIFITIVPRIIWLTVFNDVTPISDFKRNYIVSQEILYHGKLNKDLLLDGVVSLPGYISIFPHIMFYPMVLSLIYKVLFVSPLIAQYFNIVLSIGITMLLYKISKKTINSERNSIICATIWALWPSQVAQVVVLGSEYFFTFMLLLSIYFFLILYEQNNSLKNILIYSLLLGISASIANSIRPVMIVMLISMIFFYLITKKIINVKHFIVAIMLVLFSYLSTMIIVNKTISHLIQRNIVTEYAYGWNIYIGANAKTNGMWNNEDADFRNNLINSGLSANEIQKILANKAFEERIIGNSNNFIKMQPRKFGNIWGYDSFPIDIIIASTKNNHILAEKSRVLFDTYYFIAILFCLKTCISLIKGKTSNFALLYMLFIIGIALSHVFLEVQARYHFGIIPLLSLIAIQSKNNG